LYAAVTRAMCEQFTYSAFLKTCVMKKRNFGTKAEMASAIYQKRSHTNKHTHTHTHMG
jgi:hypothetical protein